VLPYSRTSNEHKYLKRCETYINQKHWESLEPPREEKIIEEKPPEEDMDLSFKRS
jgi:hypothetical protein